MFPLLHKEHIGTRSGRTGACHGVAASVLVIHVCWAPIVTAVAPMQRLLQGVVGLVEQWALPKCVRSFQPKQTLVAYSVDGDATRNNSVYSGGACHIEPSCVARSTRGYMSQGNNGGGASKRLKSSALVHVNDASKDAPCTGFLQACFDPRCNAR